MAQGETDPPAAAVGTQAWRKSERARLIAARMNMTDLAYREACAAITQKLMIELLPRLQPTVLAGYWPIRREYDCRALLEHLSVQGARVALPAVIGKDLPLQFREWSRGGAMTAGPMNIPQPATADTIAPDCLLIALVGFDKRNYRLGYGAGFYDRTLAAAAPKPVTVGIGFEVQRLDSIHPHRFDIPLDYVVTEAGITPDD